MTDDTPTTATSPEVAFDQAPFSMGLYENRRDWLNARRDSIGASEGAAVLGMHPYSTALKVWAAKMADPLPDDYTEPDDNEPTYWGHTLEPLIAQRFSQRTGLPVVHLGDLTILTSLAEPWVSCTLDRVIPNHPDYIGPGVLEIKTTDSMNAKQWADGGCPDHYFLQVQHQLAVTGYEWGMLACLIGNRSLVWVPIHRNDALIQGMLQDYRTFWHSYVLPGVEPPVSSALDLDVVKAMHPTTNGKPLTMDDRDLELVTEWEAAKDRLKELDADADRIEACLRQRVGDYAAGVLPDGRHVQLPVTTKKPQLAKDDIPAGTVLVAGSTYRTLKVGWPKKDKAPTVQTDGD